MLLPLNLNTYLCLGAFVLTTICYSYFHASFFVSKIYPVERERCDILLLDFVFSSTAGVLRSPIGQERGSNSMEMYVPPSCKINESFRVGGVETRDDTKCAAFFMSECIGRVQGRKKKVPLYIFFYEEKIGL